MQSKVHLVLLNSKSYIVLRSRILGPFKAITKTAAFGLVLALNIVNIVAVNAILVLHVSKTGRRTMLFKSLLD